MACSNLEQFPITYKSKIDGFKVMINIYKSKIVNRDFTLPYTDETRKELLNKAVLPIMMFVNKNITSKRMREHILKMITT